ncbi:MAG: class I SAM-dependent methyltransferase [Limisphaerales bacterium]
MIVTWSKGQPDDWMAEDLLVETVDRVRRHPWWQARAELALAVLQQHGLAPPAAILDVGCGWGVTLQALEAAGYRAAGLDVSREILELIDHPQRRLIEADLSQNPPETQSLYDGVLILDVLEHLDDDRGALSRVARLARPGAIIIVSVPALPSLFSEFDAIQGHRCRFLPETLRAAFEGTGFAVCRIFWWGAWMVPLLRWTRRKSNSKCGSASSRYSGYLRVPPWPAPLLMRLLFAWEKRLALKDLLRTGTSLFAVGVRLEGCDTHK